MLFQGVQSIRCPPFQGEASPKAGKVEGGKREPFDAAGSTALTTSQGLRFATRGKREALEEENIQYTTLNIQCSTERTERRLRDEA
jgi:hypothetical protein